MVSSLSLISNDTTVCVFAIASEAVARLFSMNLLVFLRLLFKRQACRKCPVVVNMMHGMAVKASAHDPSNATIKVAMKAAKTLKAYPVL